MPKKVCLASSLSTHTYIENHKKNKLCQYSARNLHEFTRLFSQFAREHILINQFLVKGELTRRLISFSPSAQYLYIIEFFSYKTFYTEFI